MEHLEHCPKAKNAPCHPGLQKSTLGAANERIHRCRYLGLDSLVRGGTLAVGAERNNGQTEIAIRASGPRVAFDANIGKALDGSLAAEELSGRTAPAHLIRLIVERDGGAVQYHHGEDALVLGAMLPDPEGMIG